MSSTGSRCSIYAKIDALGEARTVADLVARLRPVLDELAYYAVNGEAAVMETREEWHTEFSGRLHAAAAADRAATSLALEHPRAAPEPPRAAPAARAKAGEKKTARPAPANGRSLAPHAPPGRQAAGDLPPSLRAIMEGTHPSFGANEGYLG